MIRSMVLACSVYSSCLPHSHPFQGDILLGVFGSDTSMKYLHKQKIKVHHTSVSCVYKCHKLKNFIFRFSFLHFSPFCPLISRPIIFAQRTLLISLGLFQSPVLCEATFTCPHCSRWGRLPEVSQPQGNRSQSQTSLPLFWQKYVYFLSANYVESKCPPLVVLPSFPLNLSLLYCRCHISQKMLS